MSNSRIKDNIDDNNDYYVKKPTGYVAEVDGCLVEPVVYQPTPRGAEILAKHYNEKYGVNIQIVDHTLVVDQGDALAKRFAQLRKDFDTNSLQENKPIGMLLMHGQNHAVPVVFSRENDVNYMMIFDSTSGCRKKGYYQIAAMFPDCKVLLNNGTRQKDIGSCVTDGISILKDTLRLPQIGTSLINNKNIPITDDTPCDGRPRRFATPKLPSNFSIFRMPEELLKTAQVTKFVEEATPDYQKVITKKNETLEEKRKANRITVALNENPTQDIGINNYLHQKSQKHAEIISNEVKTPKCK